jgi:hypothetical protein
MAARDRYSEPAARRPIDTALDGLILRNFGELPMNWKQRSLRGPRWNRNYWD